MKRIFFRIHSIILISFIILAGILSYGGTPFIPANSWSGECECGVGGGGDYCSECLTPMIMYTNWGRNNNTKIDLIIRTHTYWDAKCHTWLCYVDPDTGEWVEEHTRGGYAPNTHRGYWIERSTHIWRCGHEDADWWLGRTIFQHDAIFTGLPPDTPMKYTVKCDEETPCAICSHWQMAEDIQIRSPYLKKKPSPDEMKTFNFAVIADVWQGVAKPTKDVRDAIQRLWRLKKVDFVLGAGDISNLEGESADYYYKIFPRYAEMLKHIPFYWVAGNHEYNTYEDGEAFFRLANVPNRAHPEDRPWRREEFNAPEYNYKSGTETDNYKSYYSFNYGHIKFLAVHHMPHKYDHYYDKGLLKRGEPQYEWLENELIDAQNNDMVKIVFMHSPINNCFRRAAEDNDWINIQKCDDDKPDRPFNDREKYFAITERDFYDLLKEYEVDLVFAGHIHPLGARLRNKYRDKSGRQPKICMTDSEKKEPWMFIVPASGACHECNDNTCLWLDKVGFVHVKVEDKNLIRIYSYSVNRYKDTPTVIWHYDPNTRLLFLIEDEVTGRTDTNPLIVSNSKLNFGEVYYSRSTYKELSLYNSACYPMTVNFSIRGENYNNFRILNDSIMEIQPYDTVPLSVEFKPRLLPEGAIPDRDKKSATLTITAKNHQESYNTVELTGYALCPLDIVDPIGDFWGVYSKSTYNKLSLYNIADFPITVNFLITGEYASDFRIQNDSVREIAPNDQITLSIEFTPVKQPERANVYEERRYAWLEIRIDDHLIERICLTGFAFSALQIHPIEINFEFEIRESQSRFIDIDGLLAKKELIISNQGSIPITVSWNITGEDSNAFYYDIKIAPDPVTGLIEPLKGEESKKIHIYFSPSDDESLRKSYSATFVIESDDPWIPHWEVPLSVVYLFEDITPKVKWDRGWTIPEYFIWPWINIVQPYIPYTPYTPPIPDPFPLSIGGASGIGFPSVSPGGIGGIGRINFPGSFPGSIAGISGIGFPSISPGGISGIRGIGFLGGFPGSISDIGGINFPSGVSVGFPPLTTSLIPKLNHQLCW